MKAVFVHFFYKREEWSFYSNAAFSTNITMIDLDPTLTGGVNLVIIYKVV